MTPSLLRIFVYTVLLSFMEQTSALGTTPFKNIQTLNAPHVKTDSIAGHNFDRTQHLGRKQSALNVVGGSAVASSIALPKLSTIVGTTVTPTLLGLYRFEYAVSYAYGTATAGTAALVLRSLLSMSSSVTSPFLCLAKLHAAALVFYGIRLNLFLLYRELFIKRFRKMRETIESKRTKKTDNLISRILSRTPLILSCAFLYAGLAYPTILSASMFQTSAVLTSCPLVLKVYKAMVLTTWFGFILGAIGDFQKTYVKSMRGEDHLVTGGVYRFLRHPNYTGEIIGWTASFFASMSSIVAANNGFNMQVVKSFAAPVLTSSLGWFGILFVLLGATGGLEAKQEEKYGCTKEYKDWVEKSWKGFVLTKKQK